MHGTRLEQVWIKVMWKTHVFYWHTYVNVGSSAPAVSLHKLNSTVQCSHLIILECLVALFSKRGWPYPSCLLDWYLSMKGTCSYFLLLHFTLVILCSSVYFLAKHAIHCLPVHQKMWKALGLWNKVPVHLCFSEKKAAALHSSISSVSHNIQWFGFGFFFWRGEEDISFFLCVSKKRMH